MSANSNKGIRSQTLEEIRYETATTETQTSRELPRSHDTLHGALFELMPSSVVLLDTKGFVRDANPFFCRGIGYSREELIGQHVSKFSKESLETIERNIHRMLAGEMLEHVITNVQKDGSTRFYELRESAVTLPDGSTGILAISNDITDRKRAEEVKLEMERRLVHAQKLESLGLMAGGIAHDFNNLLTAMMGNVELALTEIPTTSPARQFLKETLAAGKRATGLTRQMLAYSGRGNFSVADINLSELITELSEFLKSCCTKTIDLELRLATLLPAIRADGSQLQQVLVNLVTNASEAIGDQPGCVRVATSVGDFSAEELSESRLAFKPPAGRFVVLEVSDTGCGMDEPVKEKLFDPFFTTKFLGRGLGMSVVLGVVQAHRGAILLSSQINKGTTFRVLFPANPGALSLAPRPPRTEAKPLPVFSGTVLLADDEVQVRTIMERFLTRLGLTVICAEDGEQAVAQFQQRADEITFVLLDLTMPRLDGLKALAEMRRLRPNVRAVLTSGYDSGDLTQRYSNEGFDAFIQKPCSLSTLTKLVLQMCGTAA